MYHRVRRTTGSDAKVFGVCGGLSRYIDPEADPVIMRLIFVFLAIFSGILPVAIVYLVLAMVLKRDDPKEETEDPTE
jgi:phage shock protein PspC (stress-responsive transcriptional regulator)